MIVFTGKRSGLESGAVRVGRNARVVVQEQAEIPRRGRAQSSDQNGLLLHYEDATLRDLYFLDPQWLCGKPRAL